MECGILGNYLDGGGEKKGIEGIVVGIAGIVNGIVGSEVAGRGGRGIEGNVGIFGKEDGIWVLGSGSNVGFGSAWGRVGIAGSDGSVAWGRVVIAGIVGWLAWGWGCRAGRGGSVALGTVGIGGIVCRRWRAARLIWMPENNISTTRERTRV